MLGDDFPGGAFEGAGVAEPFVDGDGEGILVGGWAGFALDLFGEHVVDGACRVLDVHGGGTMGGNGDAEVAEQDVGRRFEQHVPWLDIAVDQFLVVSMLQGGGNLHDDGDDAGGRGEWLAGVALTERAALDLRATQRYNK